MTKVLVAMSGGVDSSVAAALLKKQGYFVVGAYMRNWSKEIPGVTACTFEQDQCDARRVAEKLNIPFYTFNFEKEYYDAVVKDFFAQYKAGFTPNPDVLCNKFVKFGAFLKKAKELGFDYIATGHYARVTRKTFECHSESARGETKNLYDRDPSAPVAKSSLCLRMTEKEKLRMTERVGQSQDLPLTTYHLLKGKDPKKDQSYFLWTLNQEQLSHTLFPIGDYHKEQIRKLAKEFDLPTAEKKDSQGICFIGPVQVQKFLATELKPKKGKVLDSAGNIIGEHNGAWFYTIGQRHGLGEIKNSKFKIKNKSQISNSKLQKLEENIEIPPLYVISKDMKANTITVGEDAKLLKQDLIVKNTHLIRPEVDLAKIKDLKAKIRYGQEGQEVEEVTKDSKDKKVANKIKGEKGEEGVDEGKFKITFAEPQRAITPGQSIVFYDGEECLGGGVIGE